MKTKLGKGQMFSQSPKTFETPPAGAFLSKAWIALNGGPNGKLLSISHAQMPLAAPHSGPLPGSTHAQGRLLGHQQSWGFARPRTLVTA